jgi:hypothetical protein
MIWTLIDQLGSEIWKGATGSFWFWLKGFSSLAVVGTAWFFTIRQKEGRSFKSLVRYIFPKGLFTSDHAARLLEWLVLISDLESIDRLARRRKAGRAFRDLSDA